MKGSQSIGGTGIGAALSHGRTSDVVLADVLFGSPQQLVRCYKHRYKQDPIIPQTGYLLLKTKSVS